MSEAERFGHSDISNILQLWISRDCDTLTCESGKELLQKIMMTHSVVAE